MSICAAYARYSSEEQRATSIEDQLRRCQETAARLGLTLSPERTYSDSAISGSGSSTGRRTGYLSLVEAAESGLFNVLFVDEVSRLSRDLMECMHVMSLFERNGIRLVTSDGLDTTANGWKLPYILKAFVAEQETEQMAFRIRRGLEGQLERGYQICPAPYGYRVVPRVGVGRGAGGSMWETVDAEVRVVKEIFRRRGEGQSCNTIALDFDHLGIPAPGVNRRNGSAGWRPSSIHRITRNPIYRGVFVRHSSPAAKKLAKSKRRTIVPEEFARPSLRIVDDEAWAEANRASNRTGSHRRAAWGSCKRLLTGLVECGDCGSRITIGGDARSRTMFCPQCRLDHKHGRREEWIGYTSEGAASTALRWALDQLLTEPVRVRYREMLQAALEEGPNAEVAVLEKRLSDATVVSGRLRRALLDPALADDEDLAGRLAETRMQERELKAQLEKLKAAQGHVSPEVVAKQLAADPADVLAALMAHPVDVPLSNAVLGRLLQRFAFIRRPQKYVADFEIEIAVGELLASVSGTKAVSAGIMRFRITAMSCPRRPGHWTAQGEVMSVQQD